MLWDNPEHTVAIWALSTGTDSGGGVSNTFTSVASAVPCQINTSSAAEREMYAQQGIVVSHTVAFLASALPVTIVRGMKLVAADGGNSLHVQGIRKGRSLLMVPAFVYADCSENLG